MKELLPCPFCGGEVEVQCSETTFSNSGYVFYIDCSCGCGRVKSKEHRRHVIEAWNRRTTSHNSDYMSCNGCKYHKVGKCILPAPNNCIRDADDYYTDI